MKRTVLELSMWVMIGVLCTVLIFSFTSCAPAVQPTVQPEAKPELTELIITSDSVAFDNIKRSERTVFQFKKNTMIHSDQMGDYIFEIKERDADGTLHVYCDCNEKEYKMIISATPGTWGIRMIHPERTIFFHIQTVTKKPW